MILEGRTFGEFVYVVFTHMPSKSHRKWFSSLFCVHVSFEHNIVNASQTLLGLIQFLMISREYIETRCHWRWWTELIVFESPVNHTGSPQDNQTPSQANSHFENSHV